MVHGYMAFEWCFVLYSMCFGLYTYNNINTIEDITWSTFNYISIRAASYFNEPSVLMLVIAKQMQPSTYHY